LNALQTVATHGFFGFVGVEKERPGCDRPVVLAGTLPTFHAQQGSPSSSPLVKPSPSESGQHIASVHPAFAAFVFLKSLRERGGERSECERWAARRTHNGGSSRVRITGYALAKRILRTPAIGVNVSNCLVVFAQD
jgi:hypothetical protein